MSGRTRGNRSTHKIEEDFKFPDFVRDRIRNQAPPAPLAPPAPAPPPVPPPPPPVPPVPMAAAAPKVWTVNPNLRDFNPGTAIGAKMFERKTKKTQILVPLETLLPRFPSNMQQM